MCNFGVFVLMFTMIIVGSVCFPLNIIAVWAADITLFVIEPMIYLLLSIHNFILFLVVKLSFCSGYNGPYF